MEAMTGLRHVELVMGTAVSIDVRDDSVGPGAVEEVVAWLHHVDDTYSTYQMTSPISRLGLGELSVDDMTDEVRDVLAQCEAMRIEPFGAGTA